MCSRILMHLQKLPGNIMTKNRYLSNYIPSLHLKTSGTAIFSSPEDFWNSYSPGSYDLIFLDIYIKQANGMDLAAQLREKATPVLLFLLLAAMLLRLPVTTCRQLIIF